MPDSPKKHKHSSSSSSSDDEERHRHHQPPPPPVPPAGYPAPYPPGQPGGYPYPPPNYNNYPTQAPPAAYYNHTGYPNQQELNAYTSLIRGFLIGMMILFFLMFASTIVVWAVLRPEPPEFQVESLTVKKFSAKPSSFAAGFEANVTARNPNKKIALYFSRIETFMFFERQALADSFADPFGLEKGAEGKLTTWMAANSTAEEEREEENEAVGEMATEFKKGEVVFSLMMAVRTTFKSDTWWMRRSTVRVFCEELKVRFVGKTGDGGLDPDSNRDCLVFL
ncbi:NDR1/HIN1-like protein 1 [Linum perenne]